MTRRPTTVLSGRLPVAVALALAIATPAVAQNIGGAIDTTDPLRSSLKRPTGPAKPMPAPPALPGAKSTQGQAVPAGRPLTDMSPNDALFDAINRGDLADARDAIGRGADLNARNVLGMTPIDLSVDLSRNDITFLLLSLRGSPASAGSVRTAAARSTQPAKAPPAAPARRPAATLVAARTPPPEPPPKRQPLSGDPGTPAPQVGFLGFGGVPRQ